MHKQYDTFEAWFDAVNAEFEARCGLTAEDMPDQCWWDWWEAGYTPAEAFEETMQNEGYDSFGL